MFMKHVNTRVGSAAACETMATFSWMAAQSCSLSMVPQHILFSAITRKQSEWAFNWPFNCSVNPCGEADHQSVIFPSTMVHLRHQLYLRILCMEQMERHVGIDPIFRYPSFQKTNSDGVSVSNPLRLFQIIAPV